MFPLLQIPENWCHLEKGIRALEAIYRQQEAWIYGDDMTLHARHLLGRDPTMKERAFLWVYWLEGLNYFWEEIPEREKRQLRSIINHDSFLSFQFLLGLQDLTHRQCAQRDLGHDLTPDDLLTHFVTSQFSAQLRLRLRAIVYN